MSPPLPRARRTPSFRTRTSAASGWVPAVRALFTGDTTQTMNVDAGRTASGNFFLQTGGETRNAHVPLWQVVE